MLYRNTKQYFNLSIKTGGNVIVNSNGEKVYLFAYMIISVCTPNALFVHFFL